MELKPVQDKATSFEKVVCELINKGYDVSIENQGETARMYLNDWSLVLQSNGKWLIE